MGEQRIGAGGWGYLMTVSVIADALQAVLTVTGIGMVITPLITIGVSIALGLGFAHCGAGFYKPKNAPRFIVTFLLEFLPGLNMLPLWTISTTIGISMHNLSLRLKQPQA